MRKKDRVSKIINNLNCNEEHYLLLTCPANIQYICQYDLSFSSRGFYFLLEPNGKSHLFLNELYKGKKINSQDIAIHYYLDNENIIEEILRLIPSFRQLKIDATVKLDDYLLMRKLREDLVITLSQNVETARVIKDEQEIKSLQQAMHYTDTVMSQLKELIRLPSTELSISHQIITLFSQLDIHELSFSPIVATKENTAHPHHSPKEVGISQGEPMLVDLGCQVDGYRSDMTRMMMCEGIFKKEILEYFKILKEIQFGAVDMIKPGIAFADVDQYVRKELESHKLLDYYNHNLGHGIGLSAYEYPYIHNKATGEFKENMVVTIGPGIYIQNQFGLRIEDVVHVQKDKAKSLSNLSTDWMKFEC